MTTADPYVAERPSGRPLAVGLGEALFDCFPDRVEVGGAPLNFAIHAHALLASRGGAALPAIRVGADPLGDRCCAELARRGVSLGGVQRDSDHPTGRVLVELDSAGEPSYRFEEGVAWDHPEITDAWRDLAGRCDAVVFGTLAQRRPAALAVHEAFLRAAHPALRVLDLNLRGDYFSAELIERLLDAATAAKLNEAELAATERLLRGRGNAAADPDAAAGWLAERHGLAWVALTRGARGTVLYESGSRYESPVGDDDPPVVPAGGDSVGAGDACCAGLVAAKLLGAPPERAVALANRCGAFVASRRGATPELPPDLLAAVAARGGEFRGPE